MRDSTGEVAVITGSGSDEPTVDLPVEAVLSTEPFPRVTDLHRRSG
jgi:hypothetical protein